jgi:hypothetical protein
VRFDVRLLRLGIRYEFVDLIGDGLLRKLDEAGFDCFEYFLRKIPFKNPSIRLV